METLVTNSLETKLHNLKVNCTCPKCKSSIIVKNGKRPNGIQEYKCKDCGTKFTKFTNTILEKTRWHWDIWVKVLEMTINNFSIKKMVNILEKDYGCTNINEKTVWLWRMKLIHAIANLPQPKLTGNIQINETFIRESQKGSRNLVSYIKGEERVARQGRLNYLEFKELKSKNKLSLARVNELHNEIKKFINVNKINVSTKYLNDYILFFNYIRNYKVRNGNYPNSKKDVEKIFIDILTQKVNYTINDINNKQLDLPKPTGKYMAMLKEETEKLKILTNNTFTFNDEDNVATFNKREILLNIPKYKLYELAKYYKIHKYKKLAKWCLASLLLKQSDIDTMLYKVMLKDRVVKED